MVTEMSHLKHQNGIENDIKKLLGTRDNSGTIFNLGCIITTSR